MKVRLTIDIELPDVCAEASDDELRQNLFDDMINYMTCCHLRDALTWTAKAVKMPTGQRIADHHSLWADICEKAEWSITRNV
jgi:hypothetical protein